VRPPRQKAAGRELSVDLGNAAIDGRPVEPITVRASQVYRREDGEWKIVHRHGDNPPADQGPPMRAR
jgi:ketosteroid isomerase-like protein